MRYLPLQSVSSLFLVVIVPFPSPHLVHVNEPSLLWYVFLGHGVHVRLLKCVPLGHFPVPYKNSIIEALIEQNEVLSNSLYII